MILPQKAAPDLRQPHGPGTTAVDTEPSRPVCFQKPHLWETTPAAASPVSPFPTERAKPWTQAGTPPRGLGRTPLPLMPAAQGALSSEAAGGCGAQAHQTSVGSRLARSLWPGRPAHVVALGASHVPTCRLGASFTPPLKNAQQEADTARPGVATDGLSSPTGLSASRPAACRDRVPAPHARCVRVGTAQVPPRSCWRPATLPSTVQHPAGSTLRTQPVPPPGRGSGPVAPPRKAPQGFCHPDTRWACLFTRVCNGGLARALHAGLPGRTKKCPRRFSAVSQITWPPADRSVAVTPHSTTRHGPHVTADRGPPPLVH